MKDEASERLVGAVNTEQSGSEVEGWPLKDTEDHNLLKTHRAEIFWVGTEQSPDRRSVMCHGCCYLDSRKTAVTTQRAAEHR